MKTFIVSTLLVLTLFIVGYAALRPSPEPSYLDYQRQQLAVEQAQTLAPIWTAAQAIIIIGFPVLILGLAAGWGYVALIRFRNERKADAAGRLPVLLTDATIYQSAAVGALADYHATERTRAAIQPVPVTYSPHVTHNPTSNPSYAPRVSYDYKAERSAIELADQPVLAPANVPTFAQLLDSGRIGRGNPITLGFDATGQPVETDWKGLYSSAIGGRQGSGKSWTASGIIAQSVLHGARVAVCDIHAGDSESISNRIAPLSSAFLYQTADNPKSVITLVKNVDTILTARSTGKDHGRNVVLLVFDEFSSTLRRLGSDADLIADLLANIASEGRKFGIFALLMGHNWTADDAGGTKVRDNLTSAMVHNLRSGQARMMTGLTAASLPDDTHALAPGQFYLLPKSGEMVKVQSPFMTEGDIERVGQLLLGDGSESLYDLRRSERANAVETVAAFTANEPETNQKRTAAATAQSAVQSVILPSAEAAEVQRLFFIEKMSITEIVYRLRQVKGNQGARYQQALQEVQDLLRQGIAAQ